MFEILHLPKVSDHRRRINIEEKVKVVAAVWGTEFIFIKFLAKLAILHYRTI